MADLSVLEPMAGAGLAISLAYLALERFRYRRDVEAVASELHKKYENDAKLGEDQTMEHLQELKWLCRKPCNGHVPSGILAWVYRVFFRWQGDVWFIAFLASLSAITLIQGVAGQAGIWLKVGAYPITVVAFIACLLSIVAPGLSILLGRRCRAWAIKRAETCDDQIAHVLKISAQEASIPTSNGWADLEDDIPF